MPSLDNPYDLPALSRGVYRVPAAEGQIEWWVIDRHGTRIRREEVAASKFEDEAEILEAERTLRKWLERKDKRLLQAI